MPHIIGGREITEDYNEINIYANDDANQAKIEMWIAKNVGEALVKHYPNRQWGVDVDIPGSMVVIMCPSLCMDKGYHVAMTDDRTIQDLQARAVHAGGEILERYGISRSRKFDPDIIESMDRYFTGEAISGHASQEGEDPLK